MVYTERRCINWTHIVFQCIINFQSIIQWKTNPQFDLVNIQIQRILKKAWQHTAYDNKTTIPNYNHENLFAGIVNTSVTIIWQENANHLGLLT